MNTIRLLLICVASHEASGEFLYRRDAAEYDADIPLIRPIKPSGLRRLAREFRAELRLRFGGESARIVIRMRRIERADVIYRVAVFYGTIYGELIIA